MKKYLVTFFLGSSMLLNVNTTQCTTDYRNIAFLGCSTAAVLTGLYLLTKDNGEFGTTLTGWILLGTGFTYIVKGEDAMRLDRIASEIQDRIKKNIQ